MNHRFPSNMPIPRCRQCSGENIVQRVWSLDNLTYAYWFHCLLCCALTPGRSTVEESFEDVGWYHLNGTPWVKA